MKLSNPLPLELTTIESARVLGMSVRSVQLMVDRGELVAWRTPGGHRRIDSASVDTWLRSRAQRAMAAPQAGSRVPDRAQAQGASTRPDRHRMLLITDSAHFQKLVSLLVSRHFPRIELHVADDGIAGLALYGVLQPDALLVDLVLPGIDGAALMMSLRSHRQFSRSRLGVFTSLNEAQRAAYAFAIDQVPLIQTANLVAELPPLLSSWFPSASETSALPLASGARRLAAATKAETTNKSSTA